MIVSDKMIYIGMILLSALLGSAGQIMFKASEGNYFSLEFIVGVALYGIATLIYVKTLRHIPLSVGYPLMAVAYILVTIFSKIIYNEAINVYKMLGILLIFLGVTFIGLGSE